MEPFPGRGVAEHEVVELRPGLRHPLDGAGEAADGVAVAPQARDECGADVAGHACDEGLQVQPMLTRVENPADCGFVSRKGGGKGMNAGYFRERHEEAAFCGSGTEAGLAWACPLRFDRPVL